MKEPTKADVDQAMSLIRRHYATDENGAGGTQVNVRFEDLSMGIAKAIAQAREDAVGSFVQEVELAYEKGYLAGIGEKG